MCAIVDANVASEVFGPSPQPAGEKFFEWVNKGSNRLVAGGKLLEELDRSSEDFRVWASMAIGAGKMRIASKIDVDAKTDQIQGEGVCQSDDPHILALAQVSGARLLYSNDRALQQDFKDKDKELIDNPRGKDLHDTQQQGVQEQPQAIAWEEGSVPNQAMRAFEVVGAMASPCG